MLSERVEIITLLSISYIISNWVTTERTSPQKFFFLENSLTTYEGNSISPLDGTELKYYNTLEIRYYVQQKLKKYFS